MRFILFAFLFICAVSNVAAEFFPEVARFLDIFGAGIGLATVLALPGTSGSNFFGSRNMSLGPCNVYFGTDLKTALTGTVANSGTALTGTVALSGTTVTGTGTAFTTDLAIGNYVLIGSSYIGKVTAIASNTSLTVSVSGTVGSGATIKKAVTTLTGTGTLFLTELEVGDSITFDGLSYATISAIASDTSATLESASALFNASLYRPFTAIDLGGVDAVTVKSSTKKVGLQEAQYGESDADAVVTGGDCSVEFSITRSSLDRMAKIMQGFETRKSSGVYAGYGIGVSLGENDSDIVEQLTLVRIVGGVESTDPLDTLHFPLSAPKTEAEWKYDAKTQRLTKSMFTAYRSPNHVLNGKQLFCYAGALS